MSVQQVKFKEIADAIRVKTNSTDKIKPSEFAGKVDEVYEAGKTEGIEEGKKSEYDRFWDTIQVNGSRTDCTYLFSGGGWIPQTLKPKHKLTPINASNMFYLCGYYSGQAPVDFRTISDKFDFSKATNAANIFYGASIDFITADFSSASNLSYAFDGGYTSKISTVTLKITPVTTTISNAFRYQSKLTNLTFIEGSEIACNGLDLSYCKNLTHDSLISVINALQTKTSGTWSVTLGSTNLAKLTDAEKAIATQKGWTLA